MDDGKQLFRILSAFALCVASILAGLAFRKSAVHWILPADSLGFAVIGFRLLRGDEKPTYAKQNLRDLVVINVYAAIAIALFLLTKRYGDVRLPDWAIAISCVPQ